MVDAGFFIEQLEGDADSGRTLSFTDSSTLLLVFAANRFTRSSARVYQDRFGVGAMDWRMLVMLTREPGIPVSRASQVIGIDKAAVSRSLNRLREGGFVEVERPPGDPRRGTWSLTGAGHDLHDRILAFSMTRQARLFEDFSADEISGLNDLLRRFIDNQERLDLPGE